MKYSTILIFLTISILTSGQDFTEHIIANSYNCWSAVAIDMDKDDDIDIVGSSRFGFKVSWWENDGQENFDEHIISSSANLVMVVSAIDIDSDTDIDVVCAVQGADKILWWENDGDQNFTQQTVGDVLSPSFIYIIDIDSDNDGDVLVAACEDNSNKITLFENEGVDGFTLHIIKENWDHANSVYAADIDSDEDIDILATASFRTAPQNGEILWFENDGNLNFTEHIVINNYWRPSCAIASDVDQDGDVDVIATICLLNRILWFENDGDQNFTSNIIATNFFRPHSVFVADMDNDEDLDILGAAIDANQIAWWKNDNNTFSKQLVSDSFGGATCVFAEDIDSDGDQDILGGAQFANQIVWWENSLFTGNGENELQVTGCRLQVFPNPCSGTACLRYQVPVCRWVSLSVYDMHGQKIKTLMNEEQISGEYVVWFDGTELPPGIYFVMLQAGDQTSLIKLIKL